MPRTLNYPKTPRSTVHRESERATYDLIPIHTLINTSSVLHISFPPDPAEGPFPAILPFIGQMGSFDRPSADIGEPLDCYIHGYVSSRVMKLARASVSGEGNGEGDGEQGLPVTVAATKMDGYVLSLTPFTHSYNYRSAVLFGYATLVEDAEEKLWAMKLITESVFPGRWDNTRTPPDGGELSSTSLLKIRVVSASGKARQGNPGDDKKDLENPQVVDKYWAGVVPVWQTLGEPVPAPKNRVPEVPDHIRAYRESENESNEKHAFSAAKAIYPPPKAK